MQLVLDIRAKVTDGCNVVVDFVVLACQQHGSHLVKDDESRVHQLLLKLITRHNLTHPQVVLVN